MKIISGENATAWRTLAAERTKVRADDGYMEVIRRASSQVVTDLRRTRGVCRARRKTRQSALSAS